MTPADMIEAIIVDDLKRQAKETGSGMASGGDSGTVNYNGHFSPAAIARAIADALEQPTDCILPLTRPMIVSGGALSAEVGVLFVMPILGEPEAFTFAARPDDEITCLINHRRSLQKMRTGGGVSWLEMLAILTHVPKALLQGVTRQEAKDRCITTVIKRAEKV